LRGTKRVCQACEVRFYDLMREPIACPSCGAIHKPVAQPMVEAATRVASLAGKTSWRSRGFKRPAPALPAVDAADSHSSETAAVEDAPDEAPSQVPEDDVVLEQEADDGDVTGLLDHAAEGPKEQ
jgi:uncharacterized protein (TIGR02300 family)